MSGADADRGRQFLAIEVGFHSEYPKAAENDAVIAHLLANEGRWRRAVGKEAQVGRLPRALGPLAPGVGNVARPGPRRRRPRHRARHAPHRLHHRASNRCGDSGTAVGPAADGPFGSLAWDRFQARLRGAGIDRKGTATRFRIHAIFERSSVPHAIDRPATVVPYQCLLSVDVRRRSRIAAMITLEYHVDSCCDESPVDRCCSRDLRMPSAHVWHGSRTAPVMWVRPSEVRGARSVVISPYLTPDGCD